MMIRAMCVPLWQTRLDLAPPDCEYLRRMGHFTSSAPKPLTWRQKLRAVLQAVDALVYLHTPVPGKGCTWHRDFKCAALAEGCEGARTLRSHRGRVRA